MRLHEAHSAALAASVTATTEGRAHLPTADIQVKIYHLAESMVENERVPSTAPETYTFTRPGLRRRSRRSGIPNEDFPDSNRRRWSELPRSPPKPPRSPKTDGMRAGPPSVPGRASAQSTGERTGRVPAQNSSRPSPPFSDRETREVPAPTRIPEPPPEPDRRIPREERLEINPAQEVLARPATELNSAEARQLDNIEGSKKIEPKIEPKIERPTEGNPGPATAMTRISALITVGSVVREIEIVRDTNLAFTLVSRAMARRYGMKIEGQRDIPEFTYGGRVMRAAGWTKLEWEGRDVRCLVCEDLDHPLIFGGSFHRDPESGDLVVGRPQAKE